jgi:hypothetical protein
VLRWRVRAQPPDSSGHQAVVVCHAAARQPHLAVPDHVQVEGIADLRACAVRCDAGAQDCVCVQLANCTKIVALCRSTLILLCCLTMHACALSTV